MMKVKNRKRNEKMRNNSIDCQIMAKVVLALHQLHLHLLLHLLP
jgi:hypothetical protein